MPIPPPFASEYRIATDREIRSWSFGQITKARVPGSAPLADHVGSLADQRIFGPVVDHRCGCGKYDGPKYNGMICDLCGVKVTTTDARRSRFGHIEFLVVPVEHPFDASATMRCFPVIPATYLESPSGAGLFLLYEELLANSTVLGRLIEYLTAIATRSVAWNAQDSQVFSRGMGLVRKSAI